MAFCSDLNFCLHEDCCDLEWMFLGSLNSRVKRRVSSELVP